MLYSQSTNGFYSIEINGENIPQDAVEITQKKYNDLLNGQSNGKIITANSQGNPVLKDPALLTPEQITSLVTAARSEAYKNEADPIFFKSQRGEATQEEWIAKVEEIKARFPDGVMPTKN